MHMASSEADPKTATPEVGVTAPPAESAEQQSAKASSLQHSGNCLYKDKCINPGKTLYVCNKCGGRFHHLCASQIGNSDEMNICREGCDGKARSAHTPTTTSSSPPTAKKSLQYFVPKPAGTDITVVSDDDDDDDNVLTQANKKRSRGLPPARGRKAVPTPVHTMTRSNIKSKTNTVSKTTSTDQSKFDSNHDIAQIEEQRSSSAGSDDGVKNTQQTDENEDKKPERESKGGKQPRKAPAKAAAKPSAKAPAKQPSPKPDDSDMTTLIGGRPTVNPQLPNHRRMRLPLMVHEPVVFQHPESGIICLGTVAKTVEKPEDPVSVYPINKKGSPEREAVEGLQLSDFGVVKTTDFLVYIGARYAVFGPPEYSFMGLGWGSAWLDILAERAYYHESVQAHDKMLFELKRLDVVMLKYPGVPECPVLILGLLQNRIDDSDWKVIGVVGCDNDEAATSETDALNNICFMSIKDLKKEYETSLTYLVEETAEFYMTSHPHIKMFHKAMGWIARWAQNNVSWSPQKTWRAKLTKMHPTAFKALTLKSVQPRPCVSCTNLTKQLEKANVSS